MAVAFGDAGIMTGSNIVATHLIGQMQHLAPFDGTVAKHAGIRGTTGHVLVDEVLDDAAPESVAEIDDMMRKTHAFGIALGLHDGVDRAAPFLFGDATLFHRVVRTEGDADDLIALLQKKHGADGRIDTAGHS